MKIKDPPKSIKKRLKNTLIAIPIVSLLICSFILVFNEQIENYIMRQMTQQQFTKKPKKDPNQKKAEPVYDAENIESITSQDIIDAMGSDEIAALNPEGELAIPSAGIHMPIYEGVSLWALLVGAGEQMPRDVVKNGGVGNYILAGHNVMDYGTLFSTLNYVSVGDPIYTFDGENLYTYQTDSVDLLDRYNSSVLNQVKDKSIITLYTCGDAYATTRYAVQGHLVKTTPKDKISKEDMKAFQMPNNAYSEYTAQYLYRLWYGL